MLVVESIDDILKPKQLTPVEQDNWEELKWRQEQQRKMNSYAGEVLNWMLRLGMPLRDKQNINYFMGEIQNLFHKNINVVEKGFLKDADPHDLAEFLLRQL